MPTYDNILQAIGRTPLVRLNKISEDIHSTIYAKVEYLNPGGSTKDRIALTMIEAAEKTGQLQPGGTIIEATAGNTGVGLALIAAVKKYRCIFVMPDKMSQDKINLLKAYGAEVVVTPTSVPPDSPESYNGVAERLAKEIPGAYRPNQFENPNNPLAHYLSTGPEIWSDSNGKVDVFVAGMGTGGTISGVAKYLKDQNPNIVIVGADPEGSILSGDAPKSYKVEGIGEDFIPKTFNRQLVDEMVRVSDKESFNMARRLAREEGLLVGGSCGTAVAAALKYVARLTEPNLSSHEQHQLAKEQMSGFGGMISLQLKGSFPEVERFASRLKLFLLAESLGGVESLLCYPTKMTHGSLPEAERLKRGIKDNLVRLSVGIEHQQDLQADLENALG
ncbi:pyridoxal-phosphate dependent enzyme [Nostoc sp.]|uniref:pyridoxal-phosphate dependent enzyme n=1 Tax=Nostoc sp. TaxID=1180 RepID=UPI002FF8E32C